MKSLVMALIAAVLVAGQLFTPASVVSAAACGDTYTVQKGDYLTKIAKNCGITYTALKAANPEIKDVNKIYPGQVVRIKADASIPVTGASYTVVKGDTLFLISVRYGTTVAELLKLNPSITNASRILVGQVIKLPATATTGARVNLSVRAAKPGAGVSVSVAGFPANANIDYRIGKQGQPYSAVVDGKTDASGNTSATVTVPAAAKAGEVWVVKVLTTDLAKVTEVTSLTITIQ